MGLAIRFGSRTANAIVIPPWHIEAGHKYVTMQLGGIYDEESLTTGRIEYKSRRAMPRRMVSNKSTAASASFGSYNSQRGRSGLVGNTPSVYYKNAIGMANENDNVTGQTVSYKASLFRNGAYIVLSKRNNVWVLGVIERADLSVTPKDIVLGYVMNGHVTQIWSSDICPASPEDVREEFKCELLETVDEESKETKYSLKVQKGTVVFDRYKCDDKGIISPTALGGFSGGVVTKTHYIKRFNVFEAGKMTVGTDMSSKFIDSGEIELTKNKNYVVFVYKVTPDFDMASESIVPQICVSAEDGAPNTTIKTKMNGSGALRRYVEITKETLKIPSVNNDNSFGYFEGSDINVDLSNSSGPTLPTPPADDPDNPDAEPPIEPDTPSDMGCCDCPEYASVADGPIDVFAYNVDEVEVVTKVTEKGVGYIKTDCIRHDIAKITWTPDNQEEETPGPGKFVVTQMHAGGIILRQTPVGPIVTKILAESEEPKWDGGFDICTDIKGSFDGYTKAINSGPESQ